MKRRPAGLVCAGGVSNSFLARWPSVLATLGPVKSSSLRVARRLSNSLRAGQAVEHISALRGCELIWMVVPEDALDRTVSELRCLQDSLLVVCDSRRVSDSFDTSLRLATLNAADPEERVFAAEGHADVLRRLRSVTAQERRKLIEMRPAAKPVFFAGIHLAAHLILPGYSAAVEGLRAAGFSRADAARVAQALATRAVRSYGKAGKKAWSPAAAGALRDALEDDVNTIRTVDPGVAGVYAASIEQALRYFGT
ncbi:MAG TPA: hypothetical protein VNX18_08650 [Bryobacteraceae bacterium]|jgi:hypothetical protein|nr:hypothetical protein [Bryobacteraceae bacterium]